LTINQVLPSGTLRPGDEIRIIGSGFNSLPPTTLADFQERGRERFLGAAVSFRRKSDTELLAHVPSDATNGMLRLNEVAVCQGPAANRPPVIRIFTRAYGPILTIENKLPQAPFNRSAVAISNTEIEARWMGGDPEGRDGFVVNVSDDWGRTWTRR
jgi:hypothetical protein